MREQDGLNMPELAEHPTADHIDVAVEMVARHHF